MSCQTNLKENLTPSSIRRYATYLATQVLAEAQIISRLDHSPTLVGVLAEAYGEIDKSLGAVNAYLYALNEYRNQATPCKRWFNQHESQKGANFEKDSKAHGELIDKLLAFSVNHSNVNYNIDAEAAPVARAFLREINFYCEVENAN